MFSLKIIVEIKSYVCIKDSDVSNLNKYSTKIILILGPWFARWVENMV